MVLLLFLQLFLLLMVMLVSDGRKSAWDAVLSRMSPKTVKTMQQNEYRI